MHLSENFTLGEMVKSATAEKLGIVNIPMRCHIMNMRNLCRTVLQPLRNEFGPIFINSGYRCPALNEAVHGMGASRHMLGEAADIHIRSIDEGIRYFDFILTHCPFDQLLFEYSRSGAAWIHVSTRINFTQNRRMAIRNYKANW
ncbi:MAG: peptidase M15 [Prevotella sp.]|nr:peptidase M15 [Prevotella sp.]